MDFMSWDVTTIPTTTSPLSTARPRIIARMVSMATRDSLPTLTVRRGYSTTMPTGTARRITTSPPAVQQYGQQRLAQYSAHRLGRGAGE